LDLISNDFKYLILFIYLVSNSNWKNKKGHGMLCCFSTRLIYLYTNLMLNRRLKVKAKR
jgi:hypothetical protein